MTTMDDGGSFRRGRAAAGLALALLLGVPAGSAQAIEEFWAAVKKPGTIVLMRHSNAPEGVTETDNMDFRDCKVQRNLDAAGRAQARRVGDAFRSNGIRQARVVASQYCRNRETAQLLRLGQIQEAPVLNMVHIGNPLRMRDAAAKTRDYMKSAPARPVTVLVTHVGNILAVAGANLTSGEMAAVRLEPSGSVTVLGRLMVP
jgi:phosphohistidine phosphatase SixA